MKPANILDGLDLIDEIAEETESQPVYVYLAVERKYFDLSRDQAIEKLWKPIPDYFKGYDPSRRDKQKLQETQKEVEKLSKEEENSLVSAIVHLQLRGWNTEIFTFIKSPIESPKQEAIVE